MRRSTASCSARRFAPRASPRTSPSRSASARRDARRGRIAARYSETVPAPVSGLPTQELYTLFGTAVASERGTRTLTGVEAQGMTACPCAQGLVEDGARERLRRAGLRFRGDRPHRRGVPIATHNQRGIGTLRRPARSRGRRRRPPTASHRRDLDVERDLRADEARRRARGGGEGPRQPTVRRGLRPRDDPAGDRGLPRARNGRSFTRQENLETIHRHNVVAERYGLLSEIAEELASGEHSHHHTTMREWLEEPSGLAT